MARRPAPPPPPTVESRAVAQREFESRFRQFLPEIGAIREATVLSIGRERGSLNTGFYGYPVLRQNDIPPAVASELLSILNSPQTYSPEGVGCYAPGLALRYVGTRGSFDLVVCLDCRYVDLQPDTEFRLEPLSDGGTEALRQLLQRFVTEPAQQRSTTANPSLQRTPTGRSPGWRR